MKFAELNLKVCGNTYILPNTYLCSLSIELPESTCKAAACVAFETGHIGGIDDHPAPDGMWEDVPLDLSDPMLDVNIDISYEGGEYFHFIQMAQESLGW